MPTELAQWITPAILILGSLYLDRSIRNVRIELRQDLKDLRKDLSVEIVNLRDRMDAQKEALRDRMGRIEGPLDVLREFFVHNGRGTAA